MDFYKPKKRVAKKLKNSTNSVAEVDGQDSILNKSLPMKLSEQNVAAQIDKAEQIVTSHVRNNFLDKFENLKGVRNLVLVWLFLMGSLLVSVAIFREFGRHNYGKESFSSDGIYSEGIEGEVRSLNPLFASSEPEKAFSQIAFSRLYNIDTDGKLNTELVEKAETADNYKNFTLKLHDNVTWSDDKKLTADDVIFTIDLLKNRIINPSRYKSWANVEVLKKSDLELQFSVPTASELILYTLNFPILPKHKLANIAPENLRENNFNINPVTSGVFNFKSLQSSDQKTTIVAERNDKYFLGSAKLKRFEIVAFSTKNQSVDALKTGAISASPSVKLTDFSDAEKTQLLENSAPLNHGIYAILNNSSQTLKDEKVRKAVQVGLKIDEVRAQIGDSEALNFPISNNFINEQELQIPSYDKSAAENFLNEAGWQLNGKNRQKDGQKLVITIGLVDNEIHAAIAKNIKSQLEQLGFEVEINAISKDDKSGLFIQSVLKPRNYDILIYEFDFGADADIYAFWHSSQVNAEGFNFASYADYISDDFLLNAREAKTLEEKKNQLTKFAKRWLNQAASIAIGQTKASYIYRKSVKTFSQNNKLVEDINRYSDIRYWQVEKTELYKTP